MWYISDRLRRGNIMIHGYMKQNYVFFMHTKNHLSTSHNNWETGCHAMLQSLWSAKISAELIFCNFCAVTHKSWLCGARGLKLNMCQVQQCETSHTNLSLISLSINSENRGLDTVDIFFISSCKPDNEQVCTSSNNLEISTIQAIVKKNCQNCFLQSKVMHLSKSLQPLK
jgi:hypothetical protein